MKDFFSAKKIVSMGGIVLLIILCLLYVGTHQQKSPLELTQGQQSQELMRIEVATTSAMQEQGLSGRPSIPDNYGMLFIFKNAGMYGFWMKNMLVPIDILWLDDAGVIVTLKEEVSPETYPDVFYPNKPVKYVLETRAGYAHAHALQTGTMVSGLLPLGSYVSQ